MDRSVKPNIQYRLSAISGGIFFLLFICVFGILFFVLQKQSVSESEKRELTPLPKYTFSKILSGIYMDSLDLYYADNFPFRDHLIQVSSWIDDQKGYVKDDIQIYNKEPGQPAKSKNPSLINEEEPNLVTSTEEKAPESINGQEPPFETIKSVVVFNKRAIQMFGGTKRGAQNYAQLMVTYKKQFGANVNVFCMPVPVGSDFYLPPSINKKRENAFITDLFSLLPADIIKVNCYEELEKHKNEYIQFNTDHHWTGLGAYYAYVTFSKQAGISAIPIKNFQKKVIKNFLGTLYNYTQNKSLKSNLDSVEYFKVPIETSVFYKKKGGVTEMPTKLYAEYAKGGNAYGVFLGGDYPLMRVVSSNKNGNKILVFKDSYGNAFAPYLAPHFEEVYVIDFRYYNGNIIELVQNNGINNILFAHNVYAANSDYTVNREKSMLGLK